MGSLNRTPPAWVEPLLFRRPPCYSPVQWTDYIDGVRVEAITDRALAKSLERGRMPDYCVGCTLAYRDAMSAEQRCKPAHAADLAEESTT